MSNENLEKLENMENTEDVEKENHAEAEGTGCENCAQKTKERSGKEYKDMINRLSRIEGQIRGIKGMVEKDVYCTDILVQVAAVNAALNSFNRVIVVERGAEDTDKTGSDGTTEEEMGPGHEETEITGGGKIILFLLAGVIVILAAGRILFILVKRRKEEEEEESGDRNRN